MGVSDVTYTLPTETASGRSRLKASAESASRMASRGRAPSRLRIARLGRVTIVSIFTTEAFCKPAALATVEGLSLIHI